MEHDFHMPEDCDDETCMVCVGGLAYCKTCRKGEIELDTECPGPPESRPTASPEDVAKMFDGKVECSIRTPQDSRQIQRGYYALRKLSLWASRKTDIPIPPHVQYTLRWLREQFGYKKDRKGKPV